MKRLHFPVMIVLLCSSAVAQDVSEQRANIQLRREHEARLFDAEEQACQNKFAVNDCVHSVLVKRRQVIGNLQREENLVKDLERQRRAVEQMQSIERKAAAHQELEATLAAQDKALRHRTAAQSAVQKASEHPASSQPRVTRKALAAKDDAKQSAIELENVRSFANKAAENQKRQAERARRLKEKPSSAAPLTIPAN
jgi:hypothetical protein